MLKPNMKLKTKMKIPYRDKAVTWLTLAAMLLLTGAAGGTEPGFDSEYPAWNQALLQFAANGGFDYQAIQKDPALLDDFLKSISVLPENEYKKWNEVQKIAFWINAYNALAIKVVLDHYPPKRGLSWKAMAYPEISIQQISNVWDRSLIKIFGEDYSLNRIEHGTLRKEFEEPRIHFALVCAAHGCPPLRKEAYVPERLYEQLDDQARQFFSDPQKAKYDSSEDILHISPILRWFGKDFEKDGGPIEFAKRCMPEEAGRKLSDKAKIKWLDYDWSLNEMEAQS